jgi:hypothetical protein
MRTAQLSAQDPTTTGSSGTEGRRWSVSRRERHARSRHLNAANTSPASRPIRNTSIIRSSSPWGRSSRGCARACRSVVQKRRPDSPRVPLEIRGHVEPIDEILWAITAACDLLEVTALELPTRLERHEAIAYEILLPDHSLDQHVELVSTAGRICPQVRADSPCFMSRWRISRARLSASSVAQLSPMDSHPMRAAAPTTKSFFIPQSPRPKTSL